jgi:hypothetical protein
MKTVASFRDASQAYLAKGRLETEGISAILLDEYLVGIDWTYSQAIGGVKVQVTEADHERASKILQQDCSDKLKAMDIGASSEEVCPRCGSTSIAAQRYSLWSLIPSLLFLAPSFFGERSGDALTVVRPGKALRPHSKL